MTKSLRRMFKECAVSFKCFRNFGLVCDYEQFLIMTHRTKSLIKLIQTIYQRTAIPIATSGNFLKHARWQKVRQHLLKELMTIDFNEFEVFESPMDNGQNKLAKDVDEYEIEWLLLSDLIDTRKNATEAGKNLLDNL